MSRVLGVDYGSRRVGLAVSDPLGVGAAPLEVVERKRAVERIAELVKEREVDTIVVGLPTGLGGDEGRSAEKARELGEDLAVATGVAVVFHDERFTSRMADRTLLESGMSREERRRNVDKVAAAIVLQDYLNATR